MSRVQKVFFLLFSLSLLLTAAGCASVDDQDSMSARPWNSPRGWEHGLPDSMMQGR